MKKTVVYGLGAVLIVWAVLFLGLLPSMLTRAESMPFTASPADVGLEFSEVSIPVEDEGLVLSGWWMPARDAKSVVLFVHGANANKEDFYFRALDFYAELVEAGHHVLAIDLRNHGASDRSQDGKLAFGCHEHRDVSAALDDLETRAPDLSVIGAGVSMGGATLIHAATEEDRLEALVLIDPLLDGQSSALAGMSAILGISQTLLGPTLWSARTFFGLSGDGPEALDLGAELELPILLIQNPDDPITQSRFADELAKRNLQVTYHVVPPVSADDPAIADSGGWGTHASAFRMNRELTMHQIEDFLSGI